MNQIILGLIPRHPHFFFFFIFFQTKQNNLETDCKYSGLKSRLGNWTQGGEDRYK